jgi:hypothetical protein
MKTNHCAANKAARGGLCAVALVLLAQCGDGSQLDAKADATALTQASVADSCNLSGSWGIKFTIPVRWAPSIVVSSGFGNVQQWLKATRQHNGDNYVDTLSLCGIESPDTKTWPMFGSEVYGIIFPDQLFDSGVLPQFESSAQLAGDMPGGSFSINPLTVLIGVDLENSATASWPLAKNMTSVDADKDGKPGITIGTATDVAHKAPPVDMWRKHRASNFYIALRNVVQNAQGTFSDCDHAKGTVTIPLIDGKLAINSRVLGCIRTDGGDCTTAEYEMVDKQSSGYDLYSEATVEMTRVPDNATCVDIRKL